MDIRQTLLAEHSRSQCRKIVKYIGADKKRFAELMTVFFRGEYRVTQRAAWPISYCVQENPSLIVPYFKRLLDVLQKKEVHPAVTRNIIRLLQYVEIPNRYRGKLMTTCFEYISADNVPVAVKAFSLTVLYNLSHDYPDILSELKIIIDQRWVHETPAFKSRAKKILQRI